MKLYFPYSIFYVSQLLISLLPGRRLSKCVCVWLSMFIQPCERCQREYVSLFCCLQGGDMFGHVSLQSSGVFSPTGKTRTLDHRGRTISRQTLAKAPNSSFQKDFKPALKNHKPRLKSTLYWITIEEWCLLSNKNSLQTSRKRLPSNIDLTFLFYIL